MQLVNVAISTLQSVSDVLQMFVQVPAHPKKRWYSSVHPVVARSAMSSAQSVAQLVGVASGQACDRWQSVVQSPVAGPVPEGAQPPPGFPLAHCVYAWSSAGQVDAVMLQTP